MLTSSKSQQKKLKELEIMCWNAISIFISWFSKICWFLVKKCWCQQNSSGISRNLYFFLDLLWVRYNCPKCHHRKTYFREGAFLVPTIREQPRKKGSSPIGLQLHKAFQTTLFKIAMIIVKPWLNFELNFSFKFFYSFTGQLKKLPKSNLWW